MRFGSRSHDVDPKSAPETTGERHRLVRTLRDLADRIENAPLQRITESAAPLAAAVEPLVQLVERVLGGKGPRTRAARRGNATIDVRPADL